MHLCTFFVHFTMEVIPASLLDQQRPVHNIRSRVFFIVDNRQDEAVLKDALDRLIRDHWRKLGARLVTRKDKRVEYHIPKTFEKDYQLFSWSSTDFNHTIDKTPELSLFHAPPPAEGGLTFLHSVDDVDRIVCPATWPFERKDEPPNAPLLYVHLSLFTDATVIAISCPHVVADQFGVANIMRAWFGLTRGETPVPMVGYDVDVLREGKKSYADYPEKERFRKGKSHVRRPLEYFFVILGFILEFILYRKESSHIVFFPMPFLQRLREKYTKELTEEHGSDPGLSSGDIILGILTKFSRMHDKTSRKLTLSQMINCRGRTPELQTTEQNHGYIHNSKYTGSDIFPVKASTPVREIAYRSRKIINDDTRLEVMELNQAIICEMVRRDQILHVCEPFTRSYGITNWCLAWKGLNLDSSGSGSGSSTSEKTAESTENPKPKLKMMVLGQSGEKHTPQRAFSTAMCRTEEGFWCNFSAPVQAIALIKEYLEKDPLLENF
ncbi:hypothetical protein BJX99DRAFT_225647 [Aspergillus californicus]